MSLDGMGHLRRASNRHNSPQILTAHGIDFETKNAGAHLIVRLGDLVVDFWPGTGKYITRGANSKTGRGVFNLLKLRASTAQQGEGVGND